MVLLFITVSVQAQTIEIFSHRLDSMTTTRAESMYVDTVSYTVSIKNAFTEDTTIVLYFYASIDTNEHNNTTSAWTDSGWIPAVTVEYRYLMPIRDRSATGDSVFINAHNGVQWTQVTDSIKSAPRTTRSDSLGPSGSGWTRYKMTLYPFSDFIEIRYRDKNNNKKQGYHHGKWIESVLIGLRRRY